MAGSSATKRTVARVMTASVPSVPARNRATSKPRSGSSHSRIGGSGSVGLGLMVLSALIVGAVVTVLLFGWILLLYGIGEDLRFIREKIESGGVPPEPVDRKPLAADQKAELDL